MPFDTRTLLDRFLRYVRIDTQADEKSKTYPSSPGQLVLGKMLRDELLAGLEHEGEAPPAGIERLAMTSVPRFIAALTDAEWER